ncbi:MAG: hypothetical protein HZB23_02160 [Deltaproteobacteria bacterium]|nr:hypothetical protein [Deltaproteobacteria bacterium]
MAKKLFLITVLIFSIFVIGCKEKQYSKLYFIDFNLYVWSYMKCSLNNNYYNYIDTELRGDFIIKFENGMIISSKDKKVFFCGNRIAVEKDYRNIAIDDEGVHYYAFIRIFK